MSYADIGSPYEERSAPRASFGVATTQLDCGTPVVTVRGEVDLATAPQLEHALLEIAPAASHRVIVDLTNCTFLDSMGLKTLTAAHARLDAPYGVLALVLPDAPVRGIFALTRTEALFEIHPSVEAAAGGNDHV